MTQKREKKNTPALNLTVRLYGLHSRAKSGSGYAFLGRVCRLLHEKKKTPPKFLFI